jgi:CRP-like cAMP-binding protein
MRLPGRLRGDAKVELIGRIPLFARCSKRELRQIAALADEIGLPEGTLLVREGRPGDEFFVLVDGTVDVYKQDKLVATLGSGDFFGEISLINNSPRTATVRSTTPVHALVVSRRDFSGLLATSQQVQLKILKALADRLAPDTL